MPYKSPVFQDKLKCLLICIVACLPGVFSLMRNANLTPQLADCYRRYSNTTLDNVVGKFLSWHCEAPISMAKNYTTRLTSTQKHYVNRLAKRIDVSGNRRNKRHARRCIRKEYRMLTIRERNEFHRAVNLMKRNRVVKPNVYDALALLHSELVIFKAHGGPCFLGWHRVYMLMFEMALGDEIPGVCLPYWDSSLDSELDDPAHSYMFSAELMGNGQGPVITGPFAGWRRPALVNRPNDRQTPLLRNVGVDGQLYTRDGIEKILTRIDHTEIVTPSSDPEYDIEVQHGGVHLYVGGDMESLVTSPNDPIFFLLHAFVDYIWEIFRAKQRNMNIDPSRNYPMGHNIQYHHRDELMDMADFTCGEGYSDRFMDTVEYEISPYCTRQRPTCNSRFFRCRVETGRCIPVDPRYYPRPGHHGPGPIGPGPIGPGPIGPGPIGPGPIGPGPIGPGPIGPGPIGPHPIGPIPIGTGPIVPDPDDPCGHIEREKHHVKPYQNAYCLNGVCDINQWVFVPIKVITLRPPGFHKYGSYPVVNGNIASNSDIYQPNAFERTRQILQTRGRTPKGYAHCHDDSIGQIFVTSQGLNYEGVYKESALIDQRLATTMSIAYLAVKNPGLRGKTRALFRAADSCGRVCLTACKNYRTGLYEPCSGVIDLDSRPPQMYYRNYGDAVLNVWDYGRGNGLGMQCPTFNNDKFFLTFYCDFTDHLPWVDTMTAPPMSPIFAQRQSSLLNNGCRVSSTCVLDVSCYSATVMCRRFGETHPCRGSCGRFAVCNFGIYKEKFCSGGMSFSPKMNGCSNIPCSSQPVQPLMSPGFTTNNNNNPWNRISSRSRFSPLG